MSRSTSRRSPVPSDAPWPDRPLPVSLSAAVDDLVAGKHQGMRPVRSLPPVPRARGGERRELRGRRDGHAHVLQHRADVPGGIALLKAGSAFLHQPRVAERFRAGSAPSRWRAAACRPACLDQVLDRVGDDLAPAGIPEPGHERGEQRLRLARMHCVQQLRRSERAPGRSLHSRGMRQPDPPRSPAAPREASPCRARDPSQWSTRRP